MSFFATRAPYEPNFGNAGSGSPASQRTGVGTEIVPTDTDATKKTESKPVDWGRDLRVIAWSAGPPLVGMLLGPAGIVAGLIIGGNVLGRSIYEDFIGPPKPGMR